jgi:DNA gyrase/topoisomerase IV subunit B
VKRLAGRLPGWGTEPVALLERRADRSARVALAWRKPYWSTEPELDLAPVVHLWCNLRHSPWPGPHSVGLAQGLREVFDVAPDDDEHFTRLARGLVAVVDLSLPSPLWKGQLRNDLDSPEAVGLVRDIIVEHLPSWLAQAPELEKELRSRSAPRRDEHPWPVQRRYAPGW